VNPEFHEQFAALCALYFSDEITEEEWSLLQVHMAYCESCEQRFREFERLAKHAVPMMAAAEADKAGIPPESPEVFREAEQRLLDSLPQLHKPTVKPRFVSRGWGMALAAAAIVCLATGSVYVLRHNGSKTQSILNAHVASVVAPPGAPSVDPHALQQYRTEIQGLNQQLSEVESKLEHSHVEGESSQRELAADKAQMAKLTAERDSLAAQLADAQAESKTMRETLTSYQAGAEQRDTQLIALDAKVQELNIALGNANNAISDRDRMLDLDKDFLAHDRDIRDVMGARNLYIADIYDTTESGRAARPFGRLFYTRDRSLIFYGFDLEKQPDLQQTVAFQVWGSGADQKPVSLGLFYQDDNHKRWVMRFDDAKTLARLNMVFVTVEPPGGSHKPTGKQMLRAYLQIPSNHP
jgi:hypothetical protein